MVEAPRLSLMYERITSSVIEVLYESEISMDGSVTLFLFHPIQHSGFLKGSVLPACALSIRHPTPFLSCLPIVSLPEYLVSFQLIPLPYS